MKIAFVGKGGSGKTTLTALYSLYKASKSTQTTWSIDADLNMHLAEQMGIKDAPLALASSESMERIRTYLRGQNERIKELSHFKKTTPPSFASGFVKLDDKENYILKNFSVRKKNLYLSNVGTYYEEKIGQSCYHDFLAVLENILSHTIDKNGTVVIDMVAGIDAFAGSLHAQIDVLFLVVEPTRKSLEVFQQYMKLAEAGGIAGNVAVIANKVRTEDDKAFILEHIPQDKIVTFLSEDPYIRELDRSGGPIQIERIGKELLENLITIDKYASDRVVSYQERLKKLYDLHKKYVAQGYVKDRFGNLSEQIDPSFSFEHLIDENQQKK